MAAEMRKVKEQNSAMSAELDELRGLSDGQLAEIAKQGEAAEATESRWHAGIDKLTIESELKQYESVEAEWSKWEAREDQLSSSQLRQS